MYIHTIHIKCLKSNLIQFVDIRQIIIIILISFISTFRIAANDFL